MLLNPQLQYRFNAAAWSPSEDGNTFLIAREVKIAGGKGEPDKGDMVLIELDPSGQVISEKVVWKLDGASQLLEDARAFVCQNGQVLLGLTAVVNKNGKSTPYPALATLDSADGSIDSLPEVEIIDQFGPGKNMTPLNDSGTFIFRQNDHIHNHQLLVFDRTAFRSAEISGYIKFPTDIPWAQWRIGTTMSPIWTSKNEAVMIFHGITIKDNKYIYSLGRARLTRHNDTSLDKRYQVEVDYKPLLTPDYFLDQSGQPLVEELHPHLRRVVYACGGILRRISGQLILALYVNVGDRQTIEVQLPWKQLLNPY